MLGCKSLRWFTISRSVFLLSPPPTVRGTHLAATNSFVFFCRINFLENMEVIYLRVTLPRGQQPTKVLCATKFLHRTEELVTFKCSLIGQ